MAVIIEKSWRMKRPGIGYQNVLAKYKPAVGSVTAVNKNELPHDKTNKVASVPSEDSNQPGHPPSLIRVFAVRTKKAWVLSYPLQGWQKTGQYEY